MKITNEIPRDWKDLQNKVCKFLNEAGYESESPKTIKTVRGDVEVDVFSVSNDELIKQFICECKFWNMPVSKEKIHAFRTVVHDSGSMVGIFISKNGYQSGAYEAAYCSNVLLKDWNGFIELIERKWLKRQCFKMHQLIHPLSVYTDPLDVPLDALSDDELHKYKQINKKTIESYLICRKIGFEKIKEDSLDVDGITFTSYDELFDYFNKKFTIIIKEYEEIFKNNPIEQWKFDYGIVKYSFDDI